MVERTTPKIPIELAWDEYVASMEGRLHGQTDAFKFAWKAAKKEWVGLTDDEIMQIWGGIIKYAPSEVRIKYFARAIESKLKEVNT
jgi:hypothetical protein